MPSPPLPERDSPSRSQALLFLLKTRILQCHRATTELFSPPPRHLQTNAHLNSPVVAEKRGPLWSNVSPAEFPLTAGKVENLRQAARFLNAGEIPAGQLWSFWRQLGRTSKGRGFTKGRELRQGCLVPVIGGGLCQISGLIYQAALDAGLEVVERHAHSRTVPGSDAEQNLDATVFWNYVDLRLRGSHDWRIEIELTPTEIVVRIRSSHTTPLPHPPNTIPTPPRPAPSGDCLSCGMVACFRHPIATNNHAPALGHTAFLLDTFWPEFNRWSREQSRPRDRWFLPLNATRWRRPNYRWSPPLDALVQTATLTTLFRAFRQRHLPRQGAARQQSLIKGDATLAARYASMLDPQCRHLVVSQNLLPHLWRAGVLGGRTFDVLIERWPIAELQRRLDLAKTAHPHSATLGDFRADPTLRDAESQALAAAGRLITPHRALAEHFGSQVWLVDWAWPNPIDLHPPTTPQLFFPCSPLARKGVFELANALTDLPDLEVKYLGRAQEDAQNPFLNLRSSIATSADLATTSLLVLPAWIEHQPRLALLALASGIPVIATDACGLPDHPLLHRLPNPDALALRALLDKLLFPQSTQCVR